MNNEALTMWKLTYRFMDNVKMFMDYVYGNSNGDITLEKYQDMKKYIIDGLNSISEKYD